VSNWKRYFINIDTVKEDTVSERFLEGNLKYVEEIFSPAADFYNELERGQSPRALWIGCSDSRVVPNIITSAPPGELFVHRNIANIIRPDDPSLAAVISYAVKVLAVRDIVLCGHYGCGGLIALDNGLVKNEAVNSWLEKAAPAKEVSDKLGGDVNEEERLKVLVEENVRLQLKNLLLIDEVKEGVEQKKLSCHGWVYDLGTGLIKVIDKIE